MEITAKEYQQRRLDLLSRLEKNSIAIIPSAKETLRNKDVHFPFRQHSEFFYLTGFVEPDAVAVLSNKKNNFILFNRAVDPDREIWDGPCVGQKDACKIYGANDAFPIDQIDEELQQLLLNCDHLYYVFGIDESLDKKILVWLGEIRGLERNGISVPNEIIDLGATLHEMRLYKSESEIACMRKAGEITAKAHRRAMQTCKPGMMEYQLEAEILHEFFQHGCRSPAYNSIVGSGENACVLHYINNDKEMNDGDLVLIDAGAEYSYYASDVTRTFPVNGTFSEEQKAIYEIVLAAQTAGINQVKPGVEWSKIQETIVEVITQGLVDLKILKGDVKELIESRKYKDFYMHSSGHWLGLDVHDVGSYKIDDKWRKLEPGMTLTVEPGIYITSGQKSVNKKWWGIGIRIEDDILVTESGNEVMTAAVPKTIPDIEELMRGRS